MTSRRLTNNSVSTLEEQSDILKSILSKESKDKKIRRKKEKLTGNSEKRAKPAATVSCSDAHNMADIDDQSVRSDEAPTWSEAQAVQSGLMVLGNAVPGYQFGQLDTDEGDSVMDEASVDIQRPVHDMSEDDQEVDHDLDIDSVDHVDSEVEQEPVIPVKPVIQIRKKGIYAEILKENIARVKEADKVAPKLSPEIAFGVDKYLKECVYTSEMEKLSKQYHRVENVKSMKVPRLDTEVYQVVHQNIRNTDQSLQTIQKAIMSSIAALAPLLELGFERADSDKELDECSRGLWDSVQLMSHALNGISSRRRELIKPSLAPIYARILTKGHETTPEWLYGGNLVETTKKCEASKKISEKILKPKPQQQTNKIVGGSRGAKQGSRGRGQLRGFNPYQPYRRQQGQQQQMQQTSQQYYNQSGVQPEYQRYQKQQVQVPYVQQQQINRVSRRTRPTTFPSRCEFVMSF